MQVLAHWDTDIRRRFPSGRMLVPPDDIGANFVRRPATHAPREDRSIISFTMMRDNLPLFGFVTRLVSITSIHSYISPFTSWHVYAHKCPRFGLFTGHMIFFSYKSHVPCAQRLENLGERAEPRKRYMCVFISIRRGGCTVPTTLRC